METIKLGIELSDLEEDIIKYMDEIIKEKKHKEFLSNNMVYQAMEKDEEELYDKMHGGVVGTMVDYLDQYISLVKVETLDDICRGITKRTRMECYNYKYKKKHNMD